METLRRPEPQSSSVQASIRRPRKEHNFILDSNQGQVEIKIKVGENIFFWGSSKKEKLKKLKMDEILASFWSPLILIPTLLLISRILMIATWSRYELLDLASPLRLTTPSPPSFPFNSSLFNVNSKPWAELWPLADGYSAAAPLPTKNKICQNIKNLTSKNAGINVFLDCQNSYHLKLLLNHPRLWNHQILLDL